MKLSRLALFGIFITACTNESDSSAISGDSTFSMEDTSATVDVIVPAPSFHQYLLLADSSYSTANYLPAGTTALEFRPSETLDSVSLQPFSELLLYNSDRTKALDLFSGNYIISSKGGQPKAARGEPDTELAIVDYTAKTRTRLLYVGPSYLITDAVWISDSTVGVTGGELVSAERMQPLLWKLNLQQKTAALYRYKDTINVKIERYFQKRYRHLPL